MRRFNCDIYSAPFKYVLGKFWIWAGGVYFEGFDIRGKGLYAYIYMYVRMCICIYIYIYLDHIAVNIHGCVHVYMYMFI